MNLSQITNWYRHFMELQISPGDLCIDATMGNGHDTLLLAQLAGPSGTILSFDIQPQALQATQERLEKHQVHTPVKLILDSHSHMSQYASPKTVSCIVFNFGYLPGGDHSIATQKSSSIEAIQQGLTLLKKNGLMVLCIYSGKDTGYEERDGILDVIKQLDPKKYLVIASFYYNRPNDPPIPILIQKL